MEEEDIKIDHHLAPYGDWSAKVISLQAFIVYNFILTLFSPITFIISIAADSYHRAEKTTQKVESWVYKVPSNLTHGSTILVKIVGGGVLRAAYVLAILFVVIVMSVVLGVGLVHMWSEKPVAVKERLYFDFTQVNPSAVYVLGCDGVVDWRNCLEKKQQGMKIPVGHTVDVSLLLVMPQSDYNRHVGVFQLTTEVYSANGNVIARNSQPCMLPYESLPIRLIRTMMMSIPLLLGLRDETTKVAIEILSYKESYPTTQTLRAILSSRAGAYSLPQLYEAEIIIKSKLPWTRQIVYNWKWTLSVWTSMYLFIIFMIVIICFWRQLIFPTTSRYGQDSITISHDESEGQQTWTGEEEEEESEVSGLVRRWERKRPKRKAIILGLPGIEGSSSPSTVTGKEESGDSESVRFGG